MLILARFETGDALLAAARELRAEGHSGIDLHSPFPLAGAAEALGLRRSPIPRTVLIAALSGAASGYLLQLFCNAIDFPINVGNRPPHAFLSFVPITFELAVLFGALGALLALLWHLRFPSPWHPTQRSETFRSATLDGLWLSLPVDPSAWLRTGPSRSDVEGLSSRLRSLGAKELSVVSAEETEP